MVEERVSLFVVDQGPEIIVSFIASTVNGISERILGFACGRKWWTGGEFLGGVRLLLEYCAAKSMMCCNLLEMRI